MLTKLPDQVDDELRKLLHVTYSLEEVHEWLYHDQYWSDSCSIWEYMDSIFYYMAGDRCGYFEDYAAWRLKREGFHNWPEEQRVRIEANTLTLWKKLFHLEFTFEDIGKTESTNPPPSYNPAVFRILKFANEINIVNADYFEELFQSLVDPVTIRNECEFVGSYASSIYADHNHPWHPFLPPRREAVRHFEEAFFMYPQLEAASSCAVQLLDYETTGWVDGLNPLSQCRKAEKDL